MFNTIKKNWFYEGSELTKKVQNLFWTNSYPGKPKISKEENINSAIEEMMLAFTVSQGRPDIFYRFIITNLERIKIEEQKYIKPLLGVKCIGIHGVDKELVSKDYTIQYKNYSGIETKEPIFLNCDGDKFFGFNYSAGKWTRFYPDESFLNLVDPWERELFTKKGFLEYKGVAWE